MNDLQTRKQHYEYLKRKRIENENMKFYNPNKRLSRYELELIELLRDKEEYIHLLTPKQIQAIKAWEFNNYNAGLADAYLHLTKGTIYKRLFGKTINNKYEGVYKKIKKIKGLE